MSPPLDPMPPKSPVTRTTNDTPRVSATPRTEEVNKAADRDGYSLQTPSGASSATTSLQHEQLRDQRRGLGLQNEMQYFHNQARTVSCPVGGSADEAQEYALLDPIHLDTYSRRIVSTSHAISRLDQLPEELPSVSDTSSSSMDVMGEISSAGLAEDATLLSSKSAPVSVDPTSLAEAVSQLALRGRAQSPVDRSEASTPESVIIIDGNPHEIPPDSFLSSRAITPQVGTPNLRPLSMLSPNVAWPGYWSPSQVAVRSINLERPAFSPAVAVAPLAPGSVSAALNSGILNVKSTAAGTPAGLPIRQIPALHGPSSLPYARCPSGAEGEVFYDATQVQDLVWNDKDGVRESLPSVLHPEYEAMVEYNRQHKADKPNVIVLVDADLDTGTRKRSGSSSQKSIRRGSNAERHKTSNELFAERVPKLGKGQKDSTSPKKKVQSPVRALRPLNPGKLSAESPVFYPRQTVLPGFMGPPTDGVHWSIASDAQLATEVQTQLHRLIEEQKKLLALEAEELRLQLEEEQRRNMLRSMQASENIMLAEIPIQGSTAYPILTTAANVNQYPTYHPWASPQQDRAHPFYAPPPFNSVPLGYSPWIPEWGLQGDPMAMASPGIAAARWVADLTREASMDPNYWSPVFHGSRTSPVKKHSQATEGIPKQGSENPPFQDIPNNVVSSRPRPTSQSSGDLDGANNALQLSQGELPTFMSLQQIAPGSTLDEESSAGAKRAISARRGTISGGTPVKKGLYEGTQIPSSRSYQSHSAKPSLAGAPGLQARRPSQSYSAHPRMASMSHNVTKPTKISEEDGRSAPLLYSQVVQQPPASEPAADTSVAPPVLPGGWNTWSPLRPTTNLNETSASWLDSKRWAKGPTEPRNDLFPSTGLRSPSVKDDAMLAATPMRSTRRSRQPVPSPNQVLPTAVPEAEPAGLGDSARSKGSRGWRRKVKDATLQALGGLPGQTTDSKLVTEESSVNFAPQDRKPRGLRRGQQRRGKGNKAGPHTSTEATPNLASS